MQAFNIKSAGSYRYVVPNNRKTIVIFSTEPTG